MTEGRGKFITFEGGDGTGKTTQIGLFAEYLAAEYGIDTVRTREPGGTEEAEKIRALLVQRGGGDWDPLTEVLLLSAARREHLVKKILPALGCGQWVISDRFVDSTFAFQGCGMGLDQEQLQRIYREIAGDFMPDLTFILDIDPAEGLKRSGKQLADTADAAEKTEDRYERMGLEFHTRLRKGFLEIAANNPQRCVVIDAARPIEQVQAEIRRAFAERFSQKPQEALNG
ncbi:MAG: dTMP kinase [Micavibrio sp.]|nr:MAG: dTMP kinase [Micavibrio sp.]